MVYWRKLSVRLGDTLELVLLLDGVRVGRALGGVDKLVSETLGDGLGVVEGGLSGLEEIVSDGVLSKERVWNLHRWSRER